MFKVVVVDDEVKIVKTICNFIKFNLSDIEIVGTANSAIDGIKVISKTKPDLVLLDIEMPHANGFDLLESLPEREFEVIFITAYNQYAINAIKVNALDYILKPIDEDELVASIKKFQNNRTKPSKIEQLNKLLKQVNRSGSKRVKVLSSTGVEYIDIDTIVKLESMNAHLSIFLTNKTVVESSMRMKELEELLPKELFFRTHKSYLINLEKVLRYNPSDNSIIMMDDSIVALSRNKRTDFLDKMELLLMP